MVLFYRLNEPIERKKIRLLSCPYWIRVGPYPLECEPKDMMHAINSTFRGLLRYEVKENYCRLQVMLNVKKVL